MYEPHLITPFENSGLKKWFKPFLIGYEAFPQISDAYARRGVVRKREGFRTLAALPSTDKPVQSLKNWINPSTLGESLIAFSLTKSYLFIDGTQSFTIINFRPNATNSAGVAFNWTATSTDYFWACNYFSSMWATDGVGTAGQTDHIEYWNGVNAKGWNIFTPVVNGSQTLLNAALIILPYKGRLVVLNTFEGSTAFVNRARWSQIGTPYAGNATPTSISAIPVLGNPTQITSNGHGLVTGQLAGITDIIGTAGTQKLNGNTFTITKIDNNNFTVPTDTTALAYTSGGFVQSMGYPPSPYVNDINSWRDDIPGKGGYNDADTSQRIVSAEIVRDTLLVFFQRSTWRLRYTGNETLPFIWERLNTQYGAESTFSNIAFDEAALAYSRYGWIASTTNDVQRIDLDIPDDSFSIEGTNASLVGLTKVQGIRDFYRNFAYWTFLTEGATNANQIYGFNYLDKSWTIFNPTVSINCFGQYRKTDSDYTWQSFNAVDDIWSNFASPDDTWTAFGSGQQIDFPYVLGGDINGNVNLMFEFYSAPTTDQDTNFNFSITTKRFNPYFPEGCKCRLGYVDLYCTAQPGAEITLNHFTDDQQTPITVKTVALFGRGPINISTITPGATTTITTSQNHNLQSNQTAIISDVIGTIGPIINNKSYVVTVTGTKTFTITVNSIGYTYLSAGYVQSGILTQGDTKYTRVYLGAIAHMHQLQITLSDSQLADPVKGTAQFEMQAMVVWTTKCGRIRG